MVQLKKIAIKNLLYEGYGIAADGNTNWNFGNEKMQKN